MTPSKLETTELEHKSDLLLLATVGGSIEPVHKTISYWRPARIILISSRTSQAKAQEIIENSGLRKHETRIIQLESENDLAGSVRTMRELGTEVATWLDHGENYKVVVDITGGTKQMSAALALHAHRWDCTFSYIGGLDRDKEGLGIVRSGREKAFFATNPWVDLNLQAIEDYCSLFNRGDFTSALDLAEKSRRRGRDQAREFNALASLAKSYSGWELFQHGGAANSLSKIIKDDWNNLRALVNTNSNDLDTVLKSHLEKLNGITGKEDRHGKLIDDLLANANRRLVEGRFDDAMARIYRALEGMAQHALENRYGIPDTGRVQVSGVPEKLRDKWISEGLAENTENFKPLGLQKAYELLSCLGDTLGEKFEKLGLLGQKTELSARNMSILAHGWDPVNEEQVKNLFKKALELREIGLDHFPQFPILRPV